MSAMRAACFSVAATLLMAGCAATAGNGALVDPLKQRLIAREDIALQNLLLANAPDYGYGGAAGGSYLDAPYDGPAIEPPLPDLNLLPEDLPPWEETQPLPSAPDQQTSTSPAGDSAAKAAPSPENTPPATDSVQ